MINYNPSIKKLRQAEKFFRRAAVKYSKDLLKDNTPPPAPTSLPKSPLSKDLKITPDPIASPFKEQARNPNQSSGGMQNSQQGIRQGLKIKDGYSEQSPHLKTILNNFNKFYATTGPDGKPHPDTIHALHYLDSHDLLRRGVLPGLSSALLSKSFKEDVQKEHDTKIRIAKEQTDESQTQRKAKLEAYIKQAQAKFDANVAGGKRKWADPEYVEAQRKKLEEDIDKKSSNRNAPFTDEQYDARVEKGRPKTVVGSATRVLKGLLPTLQSLLGYKEGDTYPSDAKLEDDPELNDPVIKRTGQLKDAPGLLDENTSANTVENALASDRALNSRGGRSPDNQANVLRWLKNGFFNNVIKPLMSDQQLEIQNEALYHKGGAQAVLEHLERKGEISSEESLYASAAILFLGQRDDVSHELSLMGEKYLSTDGTIKSNYDPGDLWYDDNMLQTDHGIAHVVNHLHGREVVPVDRQSGLPIMNNGRQHPHITAFKSIMAPTSYGMQPGANLNTSFDVYTQAKKAWEEDGADPNKSVFGYMDIKRKVSPQEEIKLFGENTFYERCKALSNSMEYIDPNEHQRIMRLYQGGDKESKKFALQEHKNWLRKTFTDNPSLYSGADGKLLTTMDETKEGWSENPRSLNLDGNGKDDLDLIMQGALKPPKAKQLSRHTTFDLKLQRDKNSWVGDAHLLHPSDIIDHISNLEVSDRDIQKDWTTRGGSINAMLRFVKNVCKNEGEQGLHNFIEGEHTLDTLMKVWMDNSQEKDAEGKTQYDYDDEEKADYIERTKKKFLDAVPDSERENLLKGGTAKGAYIFGPKGGNFWQDISYQGGNPTKDLWFTRASLFVLGGMTSENGTLIDTPPASLREAFDLANNWVGHSLGLSSKQVQAIWWYHKKTLDTMMGVKTAGNESYVQAAQKAAKGVDSGYKGHEIDRFGPNSSAASKRSQDARAGIFSATPGQNTKSVSEILGGPPSIPNAQEIIDKNLKFRNSKKGKKLKFAQFTQAPGGMTGTPVATRTNQPFSNAVAKSPGGKNLAQGALGNQINSKGGVNTTAQNAVGDWPNGSEESIVHTAPQGTDPARLKYLAAWHGISGQKKSVLVFHPNSKGPDSLYHMTHPSTDMGEVRDSLVAAGINYKTLLPGKTNTKVLVYDPNRKLRNTVDQYATNNNLNVVENIGQGEIVGHNGDWNSAGALPKSRQAYTNIIGEYEQNNNKAGPTNNTSGAPTNGTSTSTGQAQQLSRKTKAKIKFDRSRRVLEGFLRQHNTPNKELPPVGDLLSQDLQNIKPEHLSKYQQLIPDAKWSDIEGAVSSLQKDPSLYDDMTSESNRREMYCKEHARTVLQSSGLKKLIDSLRVQNLIPEHAQHLIEDAKDGDYFSLEAISSELQHSVPSLRAFSKAAEKEYNKAGKAWDKMRTGQPQKFAKKSAHAANQYRAGAHGITFRGRNYNGGQFAPQNDGVKRFEKDSNLTHMIKKLRGV